MHYLESIYITIIGLAFGVSLISFKWNFPFHFKFFSVLLGLTFLVEFSAVYLVRIFKLGTNTHIYNIFMLVEFCAYAYYFKKVFLNKNARLFAHFLLFLLPVCWLDSTILKFGFLKWNSYFLIVGSCCTIALSLAYYAQLLRSSEPVKLLKMPEFIIATGLLIFYTCVLPYLGSLNYLNQNEPLSYTLLSVLRILNIMMYSFFIYAFICQWTTKRSLLS